MVATFRMSGHQLNIEQMRHTRNPHIHRGDRLCQCCTAHTVEDEMHVLECSEYASLRLEHAEVLGTIHEPVTDEAMYTVMNPTETAGWKALAVFLYKVFLARSIKLARSTGQVV